MFVKLLIITAVILIASLAFLGIRILIKETGRFPETQISRNNTMKKRGIKCAQNIDIGCNPTSDFSDCALCGGDRRRATGSAFYSGSDI